MGLNCIQDLLKVFNVMQWPLMEFGVCFCGMVFRVFGTMEWCSLVFSWYLAVCNGI